MGINQNNHKKWKHLKTIYSQNHHLIIPPNNTPKTFRRSFHASNGGIVTSNPQRRDPKVWGKSAGMFFFPHLGVGNFFVPKLFGVPKKNDGFFYKKHMLGSQLWILRWGSQLQTLFFVEAPKLWRFFCLGGECPPKNDINLSSWGWCTNPPRVLGVKTNHGFLVGKFVGFFVVSNFKTICLTSEKCDV